MTGDDGRRAAGRMRKLAVVGRAALPREGDEAAGEGLGRILALSDGVFAIAITLLILEIAVPAEQGAAALPAKLLGLWPRYLAYALSFLVIARYWIVHHQMFRRIARYNMTLIWLNLLLLMLVAFLPFPTAVLGQHGDTPSAAVLYAVSVGLASAVISGCWWYASGRGQLLRRDVGRAEVSALRARTLSAPVLFALTVPVAAFAPYVAEVLWIAAFPVVRAAFTWFSARNNNSGRFTAL